MDADIRFSIIVPLYNKEKYIKRTLLSVLNQTYTNFEIVIVNDGSTDNSLSVVQSLEDDRIIVYTKENGGVSAARNYGVKKAKANYIAFLDADDWWNPYFLEEMRKCILSFPKLSVFVSSFAEVYKNQQRPSKAHVLLPEGVQTLDYFEMFLKGNNSPIHSSSVVIKKEVFDSFRFNEKISTGEDLLLWMQLATHYSIGFTNKVLSFYNRDVNDSATRKLIPLERNFLLYVKSEVINSSASAIRLIDRLIVKMLFPYYLFNISPKIVDDILTQVNWSEQSMLYRMLYALPKAWVRSLYLLIKKIK